MRMAGTLDLPEELGALNNLTMVNEERLGVERLREA